jgi:aspartate racemase
VQIILSAKQAITAMFRQVKFRIFGRRQDPRASADDSVKEQKQLLASLMLKKSAGGIRFLSSFSQQSLWLLNQLDPMSTAYNLQMGVRLKGPLNLEVLKSSLQEIVNRHDVLRTQFALEDAQLLQIVVPYCAVSLPLVDLGALEESERQSAAYRSAWEDTETCFDLSAAPLFRFKLIRTGSDDHILSCVLNHIISDGWSLGTLIRELTALYVAFSTGQTSPLVPLPIQYGDYAQWQREAMASGLLDGQIHYWKRKLSGAPPLLELRTSRIRPGQQTFAGASQILPISTTLIQSLKKLSAEHDATLFMITLAAFQWLLFRYSGQKDLVVGVPVGGRNRLESEELIGLFVNTVVMRTDLSGNPRFLELLARVRTVALEGFCNSDLPFVRVVEELRPVRNARHNPIFQVMFAIIKAAVQSNAFGALQVTPYVIEGGVSPLDMTMNLIECAGEQWLVQFQYNIGLFEHELITRLLGEYVSSLQAIASNPNARLLDLERYNGTDLQQSHPAGA